jgi:TetR/AcrR family transcriptional regulator, regulator of cefoperazone and chloramphenicol sensitivity
MNHPYGTRDRLIAVARQLFAEQGFAGASVRAITRAAQANLGAITYHFGSKERLQLEVLDRMARGLADRVTAAAAAPSPAPARLGAVVHAFFAFFQDDPGAPRIMLRILAGGGPPPLPVLAQQRRILEAITGIVRAGVAAGELRPVEPFFVAFSIFSQCVWFAVIHPQIAVISGLPLGPAELTPALERHITDFVTRALAPAAGTR